MTKGLKLALIILLSIGIIGGVVAGGMWLSDDEVFATKTLSTTKFSIGGLDSKGQYVETEDSIFTKDVFECQGLECTLDFDSAISYQIYFYNDDNDFVHKTGTLTDTFVAESVPFFAKYARISITPDEDDKVGLTEVLKYADQLEVKMNREQNFENYSENKANFKYVDKTLTDGILGDATGSSVCEYIDVTKADEVLFTLAKGASFEDVNVAIYNADKTFVETVSINVDASELFISSEGINYAALNVDDIEDCAYIRLSWTGDNYPVVQVR